MGRNKICWESCRPWVRQEPAISVERVREGEKKRGSEKEWERKRRVRISRWPTADRHLVLFLRSSLDIEATQCRLVFIYSSFVSLRAPLRQPSDPLPSLCSQLDDILHRASPASSSQQQQQHYIKLSSSIPSSVALARVDCLLLPLLYRTLLSILLGSNRSRRTSLLLSLPREEKKLNKRSAAQHHPTPRSRLSTVSSRLSTVSSPVSSRFPALVFPLAKA